MSAIETSEIPPVRILIVGFGSIARRHLANIQKILPGSIVAIVTSRPDSAGIPDGIACYPDILSAHHFQADAALICNAASSHVSSALELIKDGVDIFVEKPLSMDMEGLKALNAAVEKSGIKATVGYNFRFDPTLTKFRDTIHAHEYGRPLLVFAEVGQFLPDWRPGTDYHRSVSARAELGGGALLELSHELDYLYWIFGAAEFVTGQTIKTGSLDVDVEDAVFASVQFGQCSKVYAQIRLDFLQRRPYRCCKVICENGTIVWDAIEDRIELHIQNVSKILHQGRRDGNFMYISELADFFSNDLKEKSSSATISDGIEVMRMVESIRKGSGRNWDDKINEF